MVLYFFYRQQQQQQGGRWLSGPPAPPLLPCPPQMIRMCKEQITYLGKLWDQDKPILIENMKAAVNLAKVYKDHYRLAKEQLAAQPKSKQFDFDEPAIFLKFDHFTKRLNKLTDMFTTIHQFSTLEQHTHIEGLEQMIKNLNNIIDDVKRKPYDLLDFFRNQFDRDFLEFNVNIHDLEIQLQGFVDSSFEHITSTEHAISLLAQFQVRACAGGVDGESSVRAY